MKEQNPVERGFRVSCLFLLPYFCKGGGMEGLYVDRKKYGLTYLLIKCRLGFKSRYNKKEGVHNIMYDSRKLHVFLL